MRNCKIISTYFGVRRYYPRHVDETIEMLKDLVNNEKTIDPGVDNLDVIFVNHNCGEIKGNKFLDSLVDEKVYKGKIKVIHRPYNGGEGMCMASYDYGFKKLRYKYDYWFFQEDDYKLIQPHYYKKGVEILKKNKEVAFVGYDMYGVWKFCSKKGIKNLNLLKWMSILPLILVGYRQYLQEFLLNIKKTKEVAKSGELCYCGGPNGLTHIKFPSEVVDKFGKLPYPTIPVPYYNSDPNKNSIRNRLKYQMWWILCCIIGEIGFTRIYVDLGYKLKKYPNQENLVYSYKIKKSKILYESNNIKTKGKKIKEELNIIK